MALAAHLMAIVPVQRCTMQQMRDTARWRAAWS